MPVHRFVIRHPESGSLLLVRHGSAWQLPRADLEERHTAEVEHVNAAVHARWGFLTTVLRGLGHRAHELESHSLPGALPQDWTAVPASDDVHLDAVDAEILRRHRLPPPGDCAWMQPGWWTAARAWVESQLGAAEITQTRAWESSCVARCRSRAGVKHFFKAVPAAAAREVRVTAYLADHGFPGAPEVVAADLERRWLLMRAFEGDSLDDSRSPARWRRAAGVYGRLQAMSADAIGDLRSLGCLERRVLDVESAIGALLADEVSLLPAQPEGLSHEQIRETRRLEASWRRACRTLHESGMHEALDHGDLWPSNLLVDEAACTVIDWEDAGISHPFPSLAPFLAMHREWSVDVDVETLIDDYLTGLGVRAHSSLLRTTAPVGFLELALRYWRMPASVKELHPWMYETVPFFLRQAIWWSLEG